MQAIWIPKAGPPEVLDLREAPDPIPGPGELRIRVEAAGVNFADIVARLGLYADLPGMPIVVGYEVAGVVDAVGDGVDPERLGQDVLALTRFGGYATQVCVPGTQVYPRPPGMTAQEGAALPVAYLTAWQCLHVMGGLREGNTVLIHSAGGGVGLAAVQIARARNARVLGIASTRKHEFLASLGVDHCIDGRTEDFESRVMEITRGRGVDLAIDFNGGSSFKKSFRTLSPTGRLGMSGIASAVTGKSGSRLSFLRMALTLPWFQFTPPALMNANKGVFGVNLGNLWDESERVAGWMSDILAGYGEGVLRPVIARTFPFAQAAAAHHYIQDRKNIGKVLLVP